MIKISKRSFTYTIVAVAATALLSACSGHDAEPPSAADRHRLAATDAAKFTGHERCFTQFQWPVSISTTDDHSGQWIDRNEVLDALAAVGFANRTVKYQKEITATLGTTVTLPHFEYDLTATAKPLLRTTLKKQDDGKNVSEQVLCFGKLTYNGNEAQGLVSVSDDTFMGGLFHSSESTAYNAYRNDDGSVQSQILYTLQTVPSQAAFSSEMVKLGGRSRPRTDGSDPYGTLYQAVFPVTNIAVPVRNDGHGWFIEKSYPASTGIR